MHRTGLLRAKTYFATAVKKNYNKGIIFLLFQQNLAAVEGIIWSEKYEKQSPQSINKMKSME